MSVWQQVVEEMRVSAILTLNANQTRWLLHLRESRQVQDAVKPFQIQSVRNTTLLLQTCMQSLEIKENFKELIREEEKTRKEFDKLYPGIKELKNLILEEMIRRSCEINQSFDIQIRPLILYSTAEIRMAQAGLGILGEFMRLRRDRASETIKRVGVTRRNLTPDAAETAAACWILEGIKQIFGRPYWEPACDLASAVLGSTITKDRVKAAAKVRDREWREDLDG